MTKSLMVVLLAILAVMVVFQQRDYYRNKEKQVELAFQAYLTTRGENCTHYTLSSGIPRYQLPGPNGGAYISHTKPYGTDRQNVIKLGEPGARINLLGFEQYKNKLVALVDPRYCASVIYQTMDYASEIDLETEKPWSLDGSFISFEAFVQVIVLEDGPDSFEPVFQYTERRRLYSIGYSRGALENRDTSWAETFFSDEFPPQVDLLVDYPWPATLDEWIGYEHARYYKNNGLAK